MQKFCKGGGELGVFKKGGSAQLQAASGGALEDNILKISLVILRGARLTQGGARLTQGGAGGKMAPTP